MIRKYLVILITGVVVSCTTTSKSNYKVISVDSIPNLKHYFIKVQKGKNQFTVISAYRNENLPTAKLVTISQGMQLNINLIEVEKKNNPFSPLVDSIRRGTDPIYLDGKLYYNPKNPLYYSDCIKGLQCLTDCK
jgi:hypothetical protein